jgi:hypothetical protein
VRQEVDAAPWDEGTIKVFLNNPSTTQVAVDLPQSDGVLLCFTQNSATTPEVAQTVDALFQWLGTPPKFTIALFLRDDPRRIAADEWPSRRTVNGGWTTPGDKMIFVYRSEEYERVLIHETIHALNWDWEMDTKPLECWGLGENARLAPHLMEAWTELYAEWLWCGWFNVPWSKQRAHMDAQARQVLARASAQTRAWEENTNVFAYYVLKAALAPHLPFLWTFRNGTTPQERLHVLCGLVGPRLESLRAAAAHTTPVAISMRMTADR